MAQSALLVLAICFLTVSCINNATNKKNHTHSYEHTSKLTKNIDLKFINKSTITVTVNDQSVNYLSLELIHHGRDGLKTSLLNKAVKTSETINIQDIANGLESGTLAAILKGQDQNNQPVSKVATYDLEHQLEINDAKMRRSLSN